MSLDSDAIVSQVLDELGLNINEELSSKKEPPPLHCFKFSNSLRVHVFEFD